MGTLSQTWKEIERSLMSGTTSKVISLIVFLLIAFFCIRACSSYLNSPVPIYRIAKDPSWSPLNLYGKEDNVTAFSNDLLWAIATDEHLKIELISTAPRNLLYALKDGRADAILTSMNPDLISEGSYYFSEPYYNFGAVLVVPSNTHISSLQDLDKKVVAVKRGSSVLFHLPIASSVIITPYDSPTYVLNELIQNRIDAVIMDKFTAHLFLSEFFRHKLKIASLPITIEGLRLVARKDANGAFLIEKFNRGLKTIQENGTYELLLNKWDLNLNSKVN
ncbi:MAG: substrate-binding periplasmic protein [Parachlamydiaceae bacterium]